MHAWLYNGDELFPKHVNLCSRGRNALLDLDLGPGASWDLGLFGPAWEAHLYAVAIDVDPRHPWHRQGHTRFLYSWPMVSTAHFEVLAQAHRLGALATDRARPWSATAALRRRLHFRRYRALHPRPRDRRQAAVDWARRIKIAWLDRLAWSALALHPAPLGAAGRTRADWDRLASQALPFDAPARAVLTRLEQTLVAAARARGLLFDARRYRRFHARYLLASLGPHWRYGRVSADQLHAIVARLAERRDPRSARLLDRARLELARLVFVREGRKTPGLDAAFRRYGEVRVRATRTRYRALKAEIERVRKVLAARARHGFDARVRARLHQTLAAGHDPVAAGSFYFETEHLLETSSGFTHVGLVKRLPDPKTGRPLLWMFDRVLGFHYAYPVVKLTNSVPVQLVVLSDTRRGPRHYRWVRLRVPRIFQLGGGHVSERVSWINLFTHLKQRLRPCARLWTSPGFFYAAITWLINHPRNRLTLADAWTTHIYTGYGYRSATPELLQRLRGRTLYVPVRERTDAGWGGCPARE